MTERLHFHFSLSCIGEGNGNPLQCSCLENPRDRGAWWAAVYGVTQSRTWLKQLSSSSSSSTKCEMLIKASRDVIWPGSHKEYTESRKLDIKTLAEHWKEKISMICVSSYQGQTIILWKNLRYCLAPSDRESCLQKENKNSWATVNWIYFFLFF